MANTIARPDLLVVGAGPAGLGAAAEAARHGVQVLLADEHDRPGGQLFKQIHKFFGSEAHHAGVRGYDIGRRLLAEAAAAGVELMLGARAVGLLEGRRVLLVRDGHAMVVEPACIVLATGARENALAFPGWTLPGVMTAGAAQTMVNLHGALPGRDVVMVGGGNVGLIVAYQLAEAGARVRAVVEIAPSVGGYYVHAAKVQRRGIPILTSHAVVRAVGTARVEAVEMAPVDAAGASGFVRTIPADAVCLAVGLTPRSELAALAGCGTLDCPALGGPVPIHSENLETTTPGVFVAGDAAGVEEASTALDEGRLAGLAVAERLGKLPPAQAGPLKEACRARLHELRSGRDRGRLEAKRALAGAYADARRAAGTGCCE